MKAKSIVIIGSGRSGTSFLSNLLHSNGVYAGNCTPGTLENTDVRKINDSYLEKYYNGITRSKTPYGILPDDEIVVNDEYQVKSLNFVNEMNSVVSSNLKNSWWDNNINPYWLFKDPRTTVLHDMWVKHCDVVVGVFRNPVEVVESYMKLLGVYYTDSNVDEGYATMLNYWKRFNQSLIYTFKNTDKPKYLLDFNGDVNGQVKNLFDKLNIKGGTFTYDKNKKNQNSDNMYDDDEVETIYSELKSMRNLI